MNDKKIVIITAKAHPYLMSALEQKGYYVKFLPEITYQELSQIIHTAEGLVVTTRIKIDKAILGNAPLLKWIGRLGSGMELIDVGYAVAKGIQCVSTPEGNSNAVAEHTLAMLLNLFNNITTSYLQIKEGKWIREENRGIELHGKTVGIIGYGHTGSAFAKLLNSFDVKILANDKYKLNFGDNKVNEASLQEITKEADIISFHLPLTEETKFLCNKEFLTSLQKKPYILNTSRGKIINTSDLINALQNQLISGAALDVLENENLNTLTPQQQEEFKFLTNHKHVLLTSHIAGYTHEAFYKMSTTLLDKLGI
jgi:D-3-phosphoglycerate dehydrogenase